MPVLPLARGVAVIDPTTKWRGVVVKISGRLAVQFDSVEGWVDPDSTLVDLDDPQGFGYALRCYAQRREGSGPSPLTWMPRYLNSQTTDDDRLALARACAEVTRG